MLAQFLVHWARERESKIKVHEHNTIHTCLYSVETNKAKFFLISTCTVYVYVHYTHTSFNNYTNRVTSMSIYIYIYIYIYIIYIYARVHIVKHILTYEFQI